MDDAILNKLRFYDEWPWFIRIWTPRLAIDSTFFGSNPYFSTAIDQIAGIEVEHFNHMDPVDDDDPDPEISAATLRFERLTSFKGTISDKPFLVLSGSTGFLLITPARYWSCLDNNYSTGRTENITFEDFTYDDTVESADMDDEIIGQTWMYATKSGERDRRHKDNWKVLKVSRYGISLGLENRSEWEICHLSQDMKGAIFVAFNAILGATLCNDEEDEESNDDQFENDDEAYEQSSESPEWFEILEIPQTASEKEIMAAWRTKIKQYHPDLVSGLGDKLKTVADQESQRLNAAKDQGLGEARSRL